MMKRPFFFALCVCPLLAAAQGGRVVTVNLKPTLATQLIFPAEIEHIRSGFDPDKFVEPQQYKHILYVQPVDSFSTTNLSVITVDGLHFSLKLEYDPIQAEEFYILKSQDAVYNSKAIPGTTTATGMLAAPVTKITYTDPFVGKIMQEKGYLNTRNAVKYKSFLLSITGVYTVGNLLYIRLGVDNISQIPYNFDYVGFSIQARKGRRVTSTVNQQLEPRTSYYQATSVPGKSTTEMVFGFDKFTAGAENELHIDVVEKGGARNLTLTISDDILLQAKKIQ